MRVQFDEIYATEALMDPILHIALWLEHNIVSDRFNALDQLRHPAYLFFDEVQTIERGSGQLSSWWAPPGSRSWSRTASRYASNRAATDWRVASRPSRRAPGSSPKSALSED